MEALEQWLKDNGGYLHPSTHIRYDEQRGSYMQADADLPAQAHVITVPHTMTLSCLNAMVDDEQPALKKNANYFTVESLGFFYLMSQWLNKDKSFWKPYLDILPSPKLGVGSPFSFSEQDLYWLRGSDIYASYLARHKVWQRYWLDGVAILEQEGADSEKYTWDLFLWAATIFSSRSFGSRAVRPHDSKYWTAYKAGPRGRQAALLDFSRTPSDRKEFPVLFPVMDALNHGADAEVDWWFDPGRFTLKTNQPTARGSQVFNNYGQKSNAELLMGYGFCEVNNKFDCILETLKPPPDLVQELLRATHPGYLKTSGEWNAEATTFKLTPRTTDMPDEPQAVWAGIPVELTEILYYNVLHERGLDLTSIAAETGNPDPKSFFYHGRGRQYLNRIAFHIVTSLVSKINKISEADPLLPGEPQNRNQRHAKIYRDSQLRIMTRIREGLSAYNRSLRPPLTSGRPARRPRIWTLNEFLKAWEYEDKETYDKIIQRNMQDRPPEDNAASPPISDVDTPCLSSMDLDPTTPRISKNKAPVPTSEVDENLFVMWLCYAYLVDTAKRITDDTCSPKSGLVAAWVSALRIEYGEPPDPFNGMVSRRNFAKAIWKSSDVQPWNQSFLTDWGLRITVSQGMLMKVDDEVRYVVYLGINDGDAK